MWFSTFSCKCIRSKLIDLSLALARSLTVLLFLNLPLWSLSIVTSFSNSEPLLTSLNICICEVSFIASVWVHFLLSQTNSSSENNSVCYPVLLSAHLVTCTTCKELETLYLAFSISQLKPTHWEFLVIRDISNFQVSVPCLPQPKEKKNCWAKKWGSICWASFRFTGTSAHLPKWTEYCRAPMPVGNSKNENPSIFVHFPMQTLISF